MDIIFQSGEFYSDKDFWCDLFIQVAGALIGAIVAIYLFVRQLKANRKVDEVKKAQFEKDKLIYFSASVNNITELITLQVSRLDEFVNGVSVNFVDFPLLRIYPTHDIDRLVNKVNHEDYYHAFVNQNRHTGEIAKKFANIYSVLDYFDGVLKQLIVYLEKERMYDYQKKLDFKKHVDDSQSLLSKLIKRLKREDNMNLYNPLNEIILAHLDRISKDPANLVVHKEQFLDPLINIMIHNLDDPDCYILANEVRLARVKFNDIISSNKYMAEGFNQYRQDLKSSLEKLKSNAEILTKYGYSEKSVTTPKMEIA